MHYIMTSRSMSKVQSADELASCQSKNLLEWRNDSPVSHMGTSARSADFEHE